MVHMVSADAMDEHYIAFILNIIAGFNHYDYYKYYDFKRVCRYQSPSRALKLNKKLKML